jgi:hypothetical protein
MQWSILSAVAMCGTDSRYKSVTRSGVSSRRGSRIKRGAIQDRRWILIQKGLELNRCSQSLRNLGQHGLFCVAYLRPSKLR